MDAGGPYSGQAASSEARALAQRANEWARSSWPRESGLLQIRNCNLKSTIPYLTSIGLEVQWAAQEPLEDVLRLGAVEFGANRIRHLPALPRPAGRASGENQDALRLTILTGIMLGCEDRAGLQFDRKNYFYRTCRRITRSRI